MTAFLVPTTTMAQRIVRAKRTLAEERVGFTRTGPDGAIVTLLDQDRGRWDQLLIHRGLAGLGWGQGCSR